MNTARLWLGRQWGSEPFAKRIERQAGSAPAAGCDGASSRTTPDEGRNAGTARRDQKSAAPRKSGRLGSEL